MATTHGSIVLFVSLFPTTGVSDVIGLDNRAYDQPRDLLGSGERFEEFRSTLQSLGHSLRPLNSFLTPDLANVDFLFLTQPSQVYLVS